MLGIELTKRQEQVLAEWIVANLHENEEVFVYPREVWHQRNNQVNAKVRVLDTLAKNGALRKAGTHNAYVSVTSPHLARPKYRVGDTVVCETGCFKIASIHLMGGRWAYSDGAYVYGEQDLHLFVDDIQPEPDYDAYLAEQERQHHAHLDALEDEAEVERFIEENNYHPDDPDRIEINRTDFASPQMADVWDALAELAASPAATGDNSLRVYGPQPDTLQDEYSRIGERLNDIESHWPENYYTHPEWKPLKARLREIDPIIHPSGDEEATEQPDAFEAAFLNGDYPTMREMYDTLEEAVEICGQQYTTRMEHERKQYQQLYDDYLGQGQHLDEARATIEEQAERIAALEQKVAEQHERVKELEEIVMDGTMKYHAKLLLKEWTHMIPVDVWLGEGTAIDLSREFLQAIVQLEDALKAAEEAVPGPTPIEQTMEAKARRITHLEEHVKELRRAASDVCAEWGGEDAGEAVATLGRIIGYPGY